MKWMIASDLHGSRLYTQKLLNEMDREGCERLILLGDLLYHGPRNALPDGYDPAGVANLLSARKDRILAVRGNCDADVDQMVLSFPIMAPYALLECQGRLVFLTHGDVFCPGHLPPLTKGDILIFGHIHVPRCEMHEGIMTLNPGSVSIPKENSVRGYMTMENGLFVWKALDGVELMRWQTSS